MADATVPGTPPGKPLACIVWHFPVRQDDALSKTGYKALETFWNALPSTLCEGRKTKTGDYSYPLTFPTPEKLKADTEYAVLSFRREATSPDHDYAYVYIEHDVVGIVVLFQSTVKEDWERLQKRLPEWSAKAPLLGRYATWGAFTDQQTLPKSLVADAYSSDAFLTTGGYSLWSLTADAHGNSRLFATVPNKPGVPEAFQDALIGPGAFACSPILRYQSSAAKVGWLTAQFNHKYRNKGEDGDKSKGGLRRRWKAAEARTEAALRSDTPDVPALLSEQEVEGGLTIMHRDLKEYLITLGVSAGRMERMQPRSAGNGTFSRYRRDKERVERLREAIETEIGYMEATMDRMKAVQSIFSVRLEQEKNYRNLVQTSMIGGAVLAMTAIQVLDKYDYPELRLPLVAVSGAVGYALPVLALRWHELKTRKRVADFIAIALLVATGVTLSISYLWEMYKTVFVRHQTPNAPSHSYLLAIGLAALVISLAWQCRAKLKLPIGKSLRLPHSRELATSTVTGGDQSEAAQQTNASAPPTPQPPTRTDSVDDATTKIVTLGSTRQSR